MPLDLEIIPFEDSRQFLEGRSDFLIQGTIHQMSY